MMRLTGSIAIMAMILIGCSTTEPADPVDPPSTVTADPTDSAQNTPTAASTTIASTTTTTTLPPALSRCVEGLAGRYPCSNIDLLADLSYSDLGGVPDADLVSDLWGWTDPGTGREIVMVSLARGTAFVDITTPTEPVNLGMLDVPASGDLVPIQDIKVYADHAFIVGETPGHGMQIVDLIQMATEGTLVEVANYGGFDTAHNLAIDTESGFAYAVGTNTCGGGLHIVDITEPTNPTQAGCFDAAGPIHDAQCIVYNGPGSDHQGDQLCFAATEESLSIVDVTDKANPAVIGRQTYDDVGYTHQGWLSEDQSWFFLGDEFDEIASGDNTRTIVWDIRDLDNPLPIGNFLDDIPVTNHNIFITGSTMYQANYEGGIRIFDISNPVAVSYPLLGSFDTYPSRNSNEFNGAFGVYPYFGSGVIAISNMGTGLILVRPTFEE